MTDEALIAQQARRIADLEQLVESYRTAAKAIEIEMVGIGGPLNDNFLGYSPRQLGPFGRILVLVEAIPDARRV